MYQFAAAQQASTTNLPECFQKFQTTVCTLRVNMIYPEWCKGYKLLQKNCKTFLRDSAKGFQKKKGTGDIFS